MTDREIIRMDRRKTAIHEVCHAVMATALGHPPAQVSIWFIGHEKLEEERAFGGQNRWNVPMRRRDRDQLKQLIGLAGPIGAMMFAEDTFESPEEACPMSLRDHLEFDQESLSETDLASIGDVEKVSDEAIETVVAVLLKSRALVDDLVELLELTHELTNKDLLVIEEVSELSREG